MSVNISLGTTKSKSESNSTTTVANASEVKAGGDVNVTSTKKDINITGSNVEGKDVTLNAKENLNITASKNTNKTEQSSKSSSASVGASLELGKGPSYSISGSMAKGEVSANGTTFNESNVTANKDLSFASGNDTNIKGGKLSGENVTGNVGNDLNIESKQDSNSYKENNKSVGASVGLGSNKAVSGSASVGKIDSKYESVIEQSGIYAGKDGFEINVGENTDLKGGIISSEAEKDKNKISTGTLTYEDIKNEADYKAAGAGIKVNKNNDAEYNEKGITPDIGMPASGEAESTTKATISKGAIEIRDTDKQKQDIEKLNRDTANSLNKLGEIFDKTKIEERQELANLFGELAYNEIHKLAERNNWQEGCAEKNALHALVGGIMSELTGNGFLAGASASAINEMVQKKLSEQFEGEPDKHQWASAIIGGVVSQLVAGKALAGASTAASGTKNNKLLDWVFNREELKTALEYEREERLSDLQEDKDVWEQLYVNGEISYSAILCIREDYNTKYQEIMNQTSMNVLDQLDGDSVGSFLSGFGGTAGYVLGDFAFNPSIAYAATPGMLEVENLLKDPAFIGKYLQYSQRSRQYIYKLTDSSGEVRYIGRTNNPDARRYQHAQNPEKASLKFELITRDSISYAEGRGLEQAYYEKYGGNSKLLNKIRPVNTDKEWGKFLLNIGQKLMK